MNLPSSIGALNSRIDRDAAGPWMTTQSFGRNDLLLLGPGLGFLQDSDDLFSVNRFRLMVSSPPLFCRKTHSRSGPFFGGGGQGHREAPSKEIPIVTLRNICRQANWKWEDR